MIKELLRSAIVLFLLFPFLFLIWSFPGRWDLNLSELRWAFGNSFWQSFGSATFSLLLGLWGALGLLCFSGKLKRHWRGLLELVLLLPSFLPPIFVLLSMLNLVDPFPMGLPGIILVHTVMNWGMIAVLLARVIETKLGGLIELAWIEGASKRLLWGRGILPLLWRDLASLWFFVFVLCFASFSVPLIVGGGRGTTLEVLIYEKIRFSTNWSHAVWIAILQSAFLFFVSWLLIRGRQVEARVPRNLWPLRSRSGVLLILLFGMLFILGYLQGFPQATRQLSFFQEFQSEIFNAALGTLLIGLATGALTFFLLIGVSLLVPSIWFQRFLSGYVAPSSALAGFALMALGPNGGFWPYLKIPLVLVLLSLPTLWRLGGQALVESLEKQREAALVLGANEALFSRWILIPQLSSSFASLAGLAAVWACGDFAISKLIASRDVTLGMMTETLISSGYRLGLATTMSAMVFLLGLLCFCVLKGVGYVLGRKPLS